MLIHTIKQSVHAVHVLVKEEVCFTQKILSNASIMTMLLPLITCGGEGEDPISMYVYTRHSSGCVRHSPL